MAQSLKDVMINESSEIKVGHELAEMPAESGP